MKAYDYIFYRLYKLVGKKQDEAFGVFGTSAVLSLLIFINIGNLSVVLHKKNFIPGVVVSKAEVVITMLSLLGGNFYLFYRNKRYKVITQRYSIESANLNTIGNILTILFIIFTFISIVLV